MKHIKQWNVRDVPPRYHLLGVGEGLLWMLMCGKGTGAGVAGGGQGGGAF